jgi:hypothetical protein
VLGFLLRAALGQDVHEPLESREVCRGGVKPPDVAVDLGRVNQRPALVQTLLLRLSGAATLRRKTHGQQKVKSGPMHNSPLTSKQWLCNKYRTGPHIPACSKYRMGPDKTHLLVPGQGAHLDLQALHLVLGVLYLAPQVLVRHPHLPD